MLRRITECLLLISAALYAGVLAATPDAPGQYTLLGRSSMAQAEIKLDDVHRAWLKSRQELVLGTSAPDYPPFDLSASGRDYEGLTADYADILAKSTGLPMRVLRFASREAAMAALKDGQIDMLGTANGFEARDPDIALSTPYAVDQPVLVTRTNESRSLNEDLKGLRLSMVYHYLPLQEIEKLYPKAIITTYPSYQNAINAVAFGQADVFLGDTLSTHYMISKGYLSNIRMASFGKHESYGFGFAVRRGDTRLLEVINATLNQIPKIGRAHV